MDEKFIDFLKREKELTEKLLMLSNRLREALMSQRQDLVEKISQDQHLITAKLKEMEERRLRYMVSKLSISRVEASQLRLSEIEKTVEGENKIDLRRIRIAMKKIVAELQEVNTTNRLLSNRAKTSVSNIISVLNSRNGRKVCDVKV
ncbi:MAG: flagellar export chaperone FlgN [Candidatus Kapaibacterium sp.]|nr:flagellar export chaperone FlgN [Ignavibacteriota bacterium]MCB9221467.1 flagellar export chaperone FlgN [Ignavibacteria bacterium]